MDIAHGLFLLEALAEMLFQNCRLRDGWVEMGRRPV
jgi:hypothetical protein